MGVHLHDAYASFRLGEKAKINLYDKVRYGAHHTHLTRLTGVVVAAASAVITVATHVASVAERVLKGLANIFGSPFSKNCEFSRGINQLSLGIGSIPVFAIYTPLYITAGSIITIVETLIDPKGYAAQRINAHRARLGQLSTCGS